LLFNTSVNEHKVGIDNIHDSFRVAHTASITDALSFSSNTSSFNRTGIHIIGALTGSPIIPRNSTSPIGSNPVHV